MSLLWLVHRAAAQTSSFAPPEQTRRLRQAVAYYQAIVNQNQWTTFKDRVCLKAEVTDACHVDLRKNLLLTGDLQKTVSPQDSTYEAQLKLAVMKFQRRHGLTPDGVIGNRTLEEMNVPPVQRLHQLLLNLNRWEADSQRPLEPMVLVNIPDFKLHLLDSTGKVAWQTRVIVGQTGPNFQTVPLESRLGYMVVNPTWTVPQSIFRQEIIPIMQKDPAYLSRNKMQLFRLSGHKRILVSPQSVNWHKLDPIKDAYLVVQSPGQLNALGKVKFMFANPYHIYLHDTPTKNLFTHPTRAYSHGCVRVQHPEVLATYLLHQNWASPMVSYQTLKQTAPEKIIFLPKPIKIKVAYYTCWVDDAGEIQFRKDLYGLDKKASLFSGL